MARLSGGAGRTRTNHQSVMEFGRVRPARPVEHHPLELEQFRFLGISTKGESPVAPDCVVELVGLEPTTKVLWNMGGVRPAHLVGHPCSRSKSPLLMGFSTKEESPEILL